jgi:hypothetical protein
MQRRRAPFAVLVAILAGVVLLSGAPRASGFGFITKWRIRDSPSIATHGRLVYVTASNARSKWIQKYTDRGSLISQWRLPDEHGKPMHLFGIATDAAGHVYAVATTPNSNWKTNLVLKYTSRGRLLDKWVVATGFTVQGIAADAAGNVYVPITTEDRIDKYSSQGRRLASFESPGPWKLAADREGGLFVIGRAGISLYRSDGTPVAMWSDPAPASAIAVEPGGNVVVAHGSRLETDVKVYTPEGTVVGEIGGPGRGNGRFNSGPNSVAVDGRGDVYVVTLRTIQKFGEPTSAFSLGDAKLNRRTGGARLVANVPGVGKLNIEGRGIKRARRRASLAGDVSLPVIPNPGTLAKLRRKGRATVQVEVTYTPSTAGNAQPATRSTSMTLIRVP